MAQGAAVVGEIGPRLRFEPPEHILEPFEAFDHNVRSESHFFALCRK